MKYWKAILFITFLLLSFFALYKDAKDIFSFYSILAFPIGLLIILVLVIRDLKAESKLSIHPILGLILGVIIYSGFKKYNEYRWQNQLDEVMTAIENYHTDNKKYPEDLSKLLIVLPSLSVEKHLRYHLVQENGEFILEYTEGFSTVYNYNSERKTWENYVDWAGG